VYLWDVMAEAVAPAAVEAKLSQGCNTGFAAGEAAGVVRFNGSRNQSVDIFFCHAVCSALSCWLSWGEDRGRDSAIEPPA